MNVKALRTQLRAAGYSKHARNLPAWLALNPPPSERTEGAIVVRFEVNHLDTSQELFAYATRSGGWFPICHEGAVIRERGRKTGRPKSKEGAMTPVTMRMPDDLVSRITATRPNHPFSDTVRRILRAHLRARRVR